MSTSLAAPTAGAQAAAAAARRAELQTNPPLMMITITVMLGLVMAIIDSSIVNVALNDMAGTLGASLDEIGWVATGYILANVIVMPLNGWLTARFGRRNFYATCLVVFTIASLLCGTATSVVQLVLYRIIQGFGGGALQPTAQAILFARQARGCDGDLRPRCDGRAGDRAHAGRRDRRQFLLAADLLYQYPDRHRRLFHDAALHPRSSLRRPRPLADRPDRAGFADRGSRVDSVRPRARAARGLVLLVDDRHPDHHRARLAGRVLRPRLARSAPAGRSAPAARSVSSAASACSEPR